MATPSPGPPEVLVERPPGKGPWTPKTILVIAIFFGALSGALLTYFNLRRMGHRAKATWVIGLALVGTVGMAIALAKFPDLPSWEFASTVGNFATVFLLYHLQTVEFASWMSAHPGISTASAWRAFGWGILGFAAFMTILIGATAGLSRVPDVGLTTIVPDSVSVKEEFEFALEIENNGSAAQLYSVDLGRELSNFAAILGINPQHLSVEELYFGQGTRYVLRRPLPPGKSDVVFHARAIRSGQVETVVSICVNTSLNCTFVILELQIDP